MTKSISLPEMKYWPEDADYNVAVRRFRGEAVTRRPGWYLVVHEERNGSCPKAFLYSTSDRLSREFRADTWEEAWFKAVTYAVNHYENY